MPRKSAAIVQSRNIDAKVQVPVRSDRALLKRSITNCHKTPKKPSTGRGSYLPEPKILRIQQRYISGQNKSEIAREEKCDRQTVARVVQFPEVQQFITQMQQEFFGLIPDAMAAVRYALLVEKDSIVAFRVLEATGVAPHKGERLQLTGTNPQEGLSRQAAMIAAVILEGHQNLGVDLPDGVEKALAEDSDASNGAKVSRATLPRR
jgi:hypothetical protein